ncbi:hypothetical protein ACE1SV_06800 [Streptomyces sp. E-15]
MRRECVQGDRDGADVACCGTCTAVSYPVSTKAFGVQPEWPGARRGPRCRPVRTKSAVPAGAAGAGPSHRDAQARGVKDTTSPARSPPESWPSRGVRM